MSARSATARPVPLADRIDTDATALHEALSELVRVYQFRDRDRICCHDISVTQCYALEALLRRGPSSVNDLATELYLDKSTVSRVAATLERKGYLTRTPHPDDRRAVILAVTAAGRRLHDRIRTELIAEARDLMQGFEPEVREGTARLLLKLARAAAARSGVPSPGCCPPDSSCS